MTWPRWLPLLAILVLSGLFAYLNGDERITLNLGIAIYYRVRLVPTVFGAFVLGMIAMFLLGLRHDLRMRRALRDQRLLTERSAPPERYTPPKPYSSSESYTRPDPYSPPEPRPPPDTG